MITLDAVRYQEIIHLPVMLIKAPIQIAVSFYFLWKILGFSLLAGISSLMLVSIVQYLIVCKIKALEVSIGSCNDPDEVG